MNRARKARLCISMNRTRLPLRDGGGEKGVLGNILGRDIFFLTLGRFWVGNS